ncbi:GSCFA domain-containing protein [Maribacter sp. 2308TA10-17]|uniref:GSCFA domain-containing protein n=1 Tax=Maribacter sp. 2308TA10-17 TaxID=3386276 RepID=UPI0039BD327B
MKFRSEINFTKAQNQIDYQSQLLILGSCFAKNIGNKLAYFKFQSLHNPFGILFHPVAIEKLISKAVKKESYTEEDIFFLNERWHCFDAHSDLSNPSKEILLHELNIGLENTYEQITKSTHVLITLGTAWVYCNKKTNSVVANCHKVPQKEFTKELLSVAAVQKSIENTIQSIQSVNKDVKFIFTVSPVRHLKDGFVENQRSKSHLISAIHQIMETSHFVPRTSYFESYELMMDELRDYRFYEADMIHPNEQAIDYIWEKFVEVWISPEAHPTMQKVDTIQKGLQHRPFNPESEQHQAFLKSLEKKITYLQKEHSFMEF